MSARETARAWAVRMGARRAARVVRLPRHVSQLQAAQAELRDRVAALEAELADVRHRAGLADDAIARLTDGLATVSAVTERDLAESRRLSLRVAQMTDVVFDRLSEPRADRSATGG
jgi:cell division protein FtsB